MSGTYRQLGRLALLVALALAPAALPAGGPNLAPRPLGASGMAQDVQALFEQGVDLLRRGRDEEALVVFERVLAANPSHEQAFQLWKSTDIEIWTDILTKQGDFELIGKRLIGLAEMGRLTRRDDAEAIRGLVAQLDSNDPITRRSAIRQLAAEHGEYAVPYMLGALADAGAEQRRTSVMQALTDMNLDVVVPLMAALDSPDPYLRRNVALTLGYIRDPRAVPALAAVASLDEDTGARQAAVDALARLGAQVANAAPAFVQLGQSYLDRREDSAVFEARDVVWSWQGRGLSKKAVPPGVYPEEMARWCFAHALWVQPGSAAALAGLVRAQAGEVARLEILAQSGQELGDMLEAARAGSAVVGIAGRDAVDAALSSAIAAGDFIAAAALVPAVAAVAAAPTPGLSQALASEDGALRSAAAIALGRIAVDGRGRVSSEAVRELAHVVGRQIVRLAFVIDADQERAAAIEAALLSQGMMVGKAKSGALGLGTLRRLPGVDVVLVADRLPDLTIQQVLSELQDDARFQATPRLVITDDAERASELYGESAQGVVAGGDVSGVPEVLSAGLDRDREQADLLSQQAATTLADLAAAGAEILPALDALAGTLATRPDAVALPASWALARAGTGAQVPSLVAVVADPTRSDEARASAANALARIVARGAGQIPTEGQAVLIVVIGSDAAAAVRHRAAEALGLSLQDSAVRGELARGLVSG